MSDACVSPVTIQLTGRVVDTTEETGQQATFTTPSPCRRRKRPQKAGAVGFEAALHQQDAIWQDDGSLSKLDKRHRNKDLFAIDTVNGDAWKAAQ